MLLTGRWCQTLPPVRARQPAYLLDSTLSRQDSVCLSQLAECLTASVAVSVSPAWKKEEIQLHSVLTGNIFWKASQSPSQGRHRGPAFLLLTCGLSLWTVRRIKEAEISFKEHHNQNMISCEGCFHALPCSLDFSWWGRDEEDGASHLWAVPFDKEETVVDVTLLQHLYHLSSSCFATARESSYLSLGMPCCCSWQAVRCVLWQDKLLGCITFFPSESP